jgi:acyl carrier protein phosphodiesterase
VVPPQPRNKPNFQAPPDAAWPTHLETSHKNKNRFLCSQWPYKMTGIIFTVNDLVMLAQSQDLDSRSLSPPFFAKKKRRFVQAQFIIHFVNLSVMKLVVPRFSRNIPKCVNGTSFEFFSALK